MLYSKTTNGFYNRYINGNNIPDDAVDISDDEYTTLILGQSSGKIIKSGGDGYPVLADPVITDDDILSAYENALDSYLDSVAKLDRWDNRFTFVARAAYPNKWQQKAIAFGTWMDDCNDRAYYLMLDVKSGKKELPSIEDFIKSLPKLIYP